MTVEGLIDRAYKATEYKDSRIFHIEEQYRHGLLSEEQVRMLLTNIVKGLE